VTARNNIQKFGKWLAILALTFALLVLTTYGVIRYKSHSIETFCGDVPIGETPEAILEKAKALGLITFDRVEASGVIWVLNQRSLYFRFACAVDFKDGHASGKRVMAGD
jgi:hypothetical protein